MSRAATRAHARILPWLLLTVCAWPLAAQQLVLPAARDSVKFAAIGDNGNGDRPQYEIADLMAKAHERFPFDRVIMLGDNIYGRQGPSDLVKKFSQPYKALLDAGVQFYASLGNHDDPANVKYPLWNMGGQRYYTFATKNVRFFALDSNRVDKRELAWLEGALKDAHEDWKICYFHHPIYSDGGRHGSSVDVRVLFEPLFIKYGVNVVFSGHDHIYERLTPQKGIYYFVEGASGQLRKGNTRPSAMTAKFFDQDQSFMLVEIDGDTLSFQATSRTGAVVDSGTVKRQGSDDRSQTDVRIQRAVALRPAVRGDRVHRETPQREGRDRYRRYGVPNAVRSGMGLVEMFQGRQLLDGLASLGLGQP